jgi:hypothetical protein
MAVHGSKLYTGSRGLLLQWSISSKMNVNSVRGDTPRSIVSVENRLVVCYHGRSAVSAFDDEVLFSSSYARRNG